MNITSKEANLLKAAERIVTLKSVSPENAMKAARCLMAYSKMVKERKNTSPMEHQMSIFEEPSYCVMDDYSIRIVMPNEKIDFDHCLAVLEDEYDAIVMSQDLEERNW